MSIKLSICIPTYNRAAFLGEALDSVIRQATEEVEIVVSDNASTDCTEALVRDYQTRFPRIRYHKNPENLGADRNFLKVVEQAEGEYCWLMGSDDALAEGAIAIMLAALGNADVYLCDCACVSLDMSRVVERHHRMLGAATGTIYDCRDPVQILAYFRDGVNLGSLFSFISAIIVRRSVWQAKLVIEDLIGSGWIHAARVFQMMRAGARIHYVSLPLIFARKGNDSFYATVGYTRRRLIDLDYPRVARAVFADRPEILNEVTRIIARQFFNLPVMLSDKRAAVGADGRQAAQQLADVYGREFSNLSGYRVKMVLWYALPVSVLGGLRIALRTLRGARAVATARRDTGASCGHPRHDDFPKPDQPMSASLNRCSGHGVVMAAARGRRTSMADRSE